MARAYYNEIDRHAAQWLRNLIADGQIMKGDVDERSIADVHPFELEGYDQHHFFAGVGGWSIALRLAGWPDTRPVWTGSPPCQPFSQAGKGAAADDRRHLWPAWLSLIRQRSPPIIFGEQVEAAIGWGWLDAVFADLEAIRYACGATVLPACSVGAPHIRHRVYFVAHDDGEGRRQRGAHEGEGRDADASGALGVVVNAGRARREGGEHALASGAPRAARPRDAERGPVGEPSGAFAADADAGFWRRADWLFCRDGRWRPVEPGTFPLADGLRGHTPALRAYGNAIVPQVAAQFIRAVM